MKGKMRWWNRVELGGVFPSGIRGGLVSFIGNMKQKEEKKKREINLAIL